MRSLVRVTALLLFICFAASVASAGGPLVVGGPAVGTRPAFGIDGRPFTRNPVKMPIQYRVDPGPMAVNSNGTTVIDHASGVQRVQGTTDDQRRSLGRGGPGVILIFDGGSKARGASRFVF